MRNVKFNRAAFVREILGANPQASLPEIQQAWRKAGNPPNLAPKKGTFENVRRELLEKKDRPPSRARLRLDNGRAQASGTNLAALERVEDILDNAMVEAHNLNDAEMVSLIRQARRNCTRKIVLAQNGVASR